MYRSTARALRATITTCAALVALLPLRAASAQPRAELPDTPTRGITLPDRSPTTQGDAASLESNPAGLAFVQGAELSYTIQMTTPDLEGVRDQGHALFTAIGSGGMALGASAQWLKHPALGGDLQDYRKYTLGAAIGDGRRWGLGLGYNLFGSDSSERLDAMTSWDVGLQLRMSQNVGMSLFMRDANAPFLIEGQRALPRRMGGGFAFRAWDGKLTIDQEISHLQDSGFLDLVPRLVVEPVDGLRLFGRARFEVTSTSRGEQSGLERAVFGLELSFGDLGIASSVHLDEDAALSGHSHTIWLASGKQRALFELGGHWHLINLNGPLAELPASGLFSTSSKSFVQLVLQLDRMSRDAQVEGVVLNLAGPGLGWAQAWELRERLLALRRAGKKVVTFAQQLDDKEVYISSAADAVWMLPNVTWQADGMSVRLVGYQGALKRLGVEAEFLRVRDYKTAPESFISAQPSPQSLEQTNDFVRTLYNLEVDAIASGRKLPRQRVIDAIDNAPLLPDQAKAQGFVDAIVYPDELRDALRKHFQHFGTLRAEYDPQPTSERRWGRRPEIAVLVVSGTITQGSSGSSPLGGEALSGSDTLIASIRALRADSNVRAVIVRVDSPGGSAFASDLVFRELRRLAQTKPVIASMGNVAASGGYYISAGADEIFASPATITGSIGIFAGAFNVSRLATDLGLHIPPPIQYGKVAGAFSPWAGFTPAQREALSRYLAFLYRQFLQQVAHTRPGLDEDGVDRVARGRVWTGEAARQRKLTDASGGLVDALRRAELLASLTPGQADVSVYPASGGALSGIPLLSTKTTTSLQQLILLLTPAASPGAPLPYHSALKALLRVAERAVLLPMLFPNGEALMLPPEAIEID